MKRGVLMFSLLFMASGCEFAPTEPRDGGQVLASISGSVTQDYVGTGRFTSGVNRRAPQRPALFTLTSTDISGTQSLYLMRLGRDQPAVGTYQLGGPEGLSARYERMNGNVREGYEAVSGEVEITLSMDERIEGTLRFIGVLNCTGTKVSMTCRVPADADGQSIEVSGAFAAVAR